jgi:M6 family metalloprotease-like protein
VDPTECAPPALGFGAGEGANDPRLPPTVGELRIAMLFVDFSDSPGSVAPQAIHGTYVPHVVDWYRRVSYGRLQISVEPVLRWIRLPSTLAEYRQTLFDGAIEAAVQAVDPELDFGRFDALFVITPGEVGPLASTIVDHDPLHVDGAAITSWVWLSARTLDVARANVLVHETGHVLGLPDLYDESASSHHRWDVMTASGAGGMFAWHRWKLGWLDGSQIVCLRRGAATVTLAPVERPGGTKALVFRTRNGAVVVEVRQRLGEDAAICRTGVLLSRVDFLKGSPGRAGGEVVPIRIRAAQGETARNLSRCGPQWRAPFSLRRREPSRVTAFGLRLRLLRAFADGSYRVQLKVGA